MNEYSSHAWQEKRRRDPQAKGEWRNDMVVAHLS